MDKFLLILAAPANAANPSRTSEAIRQQLTLPAAELNAEVICLQFSEESALVEQLQRARTEYAGIIINAGILARGSSALRDAISAVPLPCVEVFTADEHPNEDGHHQSVIAPVCAGVIGGFGEQSYLIALQALVYLVQRQPA